MLTAVPRTRGSFHFGNASKSIPRNQIFPRRMRAGGSGKSRGMAWASVLFPQPVSPTIPATRPGFISNETSCNAWNVPAPTS